MDGGILQTAKYANYLHVTRVLLKRLQIFLRPSTSAVHVGPPMPVLGLFVEDRVVRQTIICLLTHFQLWF